MAKATVRAEYEELPIGFQCPKCHDWIETTIDLDDFTNISYGITLDETCSGCGAEFKVEVF